jgi:hypothetical protein
MPNKPAKPTAAQIRYARVTFWQVAGATGLLAPSKEKRREDALLTGVPAPCNMRKLAAELRGHGIDDRVKPARLREVWRGERTLPKTWKFRGVQLRDETWPEEVEPPYWTNGTPPTSGWYEVEGLTGGYVYLDVDTGIWWRGYTSQPKITQVEVEAPVRWRLAEGLAS